MKISFLENNINKPVFRAKLTREVKEGFSDSVWFLGEEYGRESDLYIACKKDLEDIKTLAPKVKICKKTFYERGGFEKSDFCIKKPKSDVEFMNFLCYSEEELYSEDNLFKLANKIRKLDKEYRETLQQNTESKESGFLGKIKSFFNA